MDLDRLDTFSTSSKRLDGFEQDLEFFSSSDWPTAQTADTKVLALSEGIVLAIQAAVRRLISKGLQWQNLDSDDPDSFMTRFTQTQMLSFYSDTRIAANVVSNEE